MGIIAKVIPNNILYKTTSLDQNKGLLGSPKLAKIAIIVEIMEGAFLV